MHIIIKNESILKLVTTFIKFYKVNKLLHSITFKISATTVCLQIIIKLTLKYNNKNLNLQLNK